MSNTQLLINQLHDVSTRGSLSTAYTYNTATSVVRYVVVHWTILNFMSSINIIVD